MAAHILEHLLGAAIERRGSIAQREANNKHVGWQSDFHLDFVELPFVVYQTPKRAKRVAESA